MTPANLLMLGVGLIAFAVGVALLVRRGGGAPARQAQLIAGTMALGVFLAIFAFGLRGVRQ